MHTLRAVHFNTFMLSEQKNINVFSNFFKIHNSFKRIAHKTNENSVVIQSFRSKSATDFLLLSTKDILKNVDNQTVWKNTVQVNGDQKRLVSFWVNYPHNFLFTFNMAS